MGDVLDWHPGSACLLTGVGRLLLGRRTLHNESNQNGAHSNQAGWPRGETELEGEESGAGRVSREAVLRGVLLCGNRSRIFATPMLYCLLLLCWLLQTATCEQAYSDR